VRTILAFLLLVTACEPDPDGPSSECCRLWPDTESIDQCVLERSKPNYCNDVSCLGYEVTICKVTDLATCSEAPPGAICEL
jgi:hypothetical protein